ncbi:hypothetical protein J7K93_12475 [bacterium]|nr:hypothetical protein [bacterium]
MKYLLYAVVIIIFTKNLFSQTFEAKLNQEMQQGNISATDALYFKAVRMFEPGFLPEYLKAYKEEPVKCGTQLMHQIYLHRNEFSSSQRKIVSKILSRPVLPNSFVSPQKLFKIHYTTEQSDSSSVSNADLDNSGVPDYVEETAYSLDYSFHVEVENMGFKSPPDDNNIDGPEWDVYIMDLNGFYGYTSYSDRSGGGWITYIVIDNDYKETNTKGIKGMRVTTAHEFNHVIQFGYNFRDTDIFLMEACATWMEDVVYDYVNDYIYYLPEFFRGSNYSFSYNSGMRMYGECLWFHYLSKRFGDKHLVPSIWENIVTLPVIDAIDKTLKTHGSSFNDELSLFYTWNATTGPMSDTARFYPEGDLYPQQRADRIFTLSGDTAFSVNIVGTGAAYYKFIDGNGESCMLIPLNIRRSTYSASDSAYLKISRYSKSPFLTPVGNYASAGIVSDNPQIWKCGSVDYSSEGYVNNAEVFEGAKPLSEENLPKSFPNPFNPGSGSLLTIPFLSDKEGLCVLRIITPSGFLVYKNQKMCLPDFDFYSWNGIGNIGEQVASGVYIYYILQGSNVIRKGKIAVVR